jgi:hypothetical protein
MLDRQNVANVVVDNMTKWIRRCYNVRGWEYSCVYKIVFWSFGMQPSKVRQPWLPHSVHLTLVAATCCSYRSAPATSWRFVQFRILDRQRLVTVSVVFAWNAHYVVGLVSVLSLIVLRVDTFYCFFRSFSLCQRAEWNSKPHDSLFRILSTGMQTYFHISI